MKISIILTGRNDNYGGHFEDRAILTTKYNLKQLKNRKIDYEVIFIEWNPEQERELFSKKFKKVDENIKCYVVKNDIHNSIIGEYKHMTFLEFFAKNVGLKRASGDCVIFTNADVFFCENIFETLEKQAIKDNIIYRAERYDLRFDKLNGLNDKEFLKSTFRVNPSPFKPYLDGAGDFTMATKKTFMDLNGYDENQKFVKIHKDTRILFSAFKHGDIDFEMIGRIYHIDHADSAVGDNGTLKNYRQANGPYNWKYAYNLPYKNRDFWGMDKKIFNDIKIDENIFEIKQKDGNNLSEIYSYDDKQYLMENKPEEHTQEFISLHKEIEKRYNVKIFKD